MNKLTKHQKEMIIKVVIDNPEGDLPIMLKQAIEIAEETIKENLTKHNSSFIQDCEMLIGYKSVKERQDRLNELKKEWQS